MTLNAQFFSSNLEQTDKDLFDSISNELSRQQNQVELIASENIVSKAVLEAHKYGQISGYGGKMSHYIEVKDSDYNVLREVIELLNKN